MMLPNPQYIIAPSTPPLQRSPHRFPISFSQIHFHVISIININITDYWVIYSITMVRNVKTLQGKEYSTRKIRKVIVDAEDSESVDDRSTALKEKNRQSAQKSRDNKKKYIINLELRLEEMESENQELRQRLAEVEGRYKLLEARLGEGHQSIQSVSTAMEEENEDCREASDETGSGKDSFERLSARSFISCSNFLMLALVMICCVCGFLEPMGESGVTRGLYDTKNLKNIIQRQSSMDCPQIYYGHNPPTHLKNCTTTIFDGPKSRAKLTSPLDQKQPSQEQRNN